MSAHFSDISSSFRKLFYVLPESQIPDTCFNSTVQRLFVAFATTIILDLFLQLFNLTSLLGYKFHEDQGLYLVLLTFYFNA